MFDLTEKVQKKPLQLCAEQRRGGYAAETQAKLMWSCQYNLDKWPWYKKSAASEQTERLIPGWKLNQITILVGLDNIWMKAGGHGIFSGWEEGEGTGINEWVFEICSIISRRIISAGCLDLQKYADVSDNEREVEALASFPNI